MWLHLIRIEINTLASVVWAGANGACNNPSRHAEAMWLWKCYLDSAMDWGFKLKSILVNINFKEYEWSLAIIMIETYEYMQKKFSICSVG